MSIAYILENYHVKHLSESVCHSMPILFLYHVRVKISCDDRKELMVVTVFNQVNNWIRHVTKVKNFGGFFPHIINRQHATASYIIKLFGRA